MKEILFRHIMSQDRKRSEVSLCETVDNKDSVAKIVKRCFYIVKGMSSFNHSTPQFLNFSKEKPLGKPRQIFIKKIRDTLNHTEYFFYKIMGDFYVVSKDTLFTINFRHTFEMDARKTLSRTLNQ